MPDLTWEEFALALAPSLGVPGKPSHELTVVAERVYDALVLAGVDVRAVVDGREQSVTRRPFSPSRLLAELRAEILHMSVSPFSDALVPWVQAVIAERRRLAERLESMLHEPKPDLSRLRELEAKWRAELTQQEKVRDSVLSMKEYGATSKAAMQVHCEAMALRLKQLTEALDAIEKGGA